VIADEAEALTGSYFCKEKKRALSMIIISLILLIVYLLSHTCIPKKYVNIRYFSL